MKIKQLEFKKNHWLMNSSVGHKRFHLSPTPRIPRLVPKMTTLSTLRAFCVVMNWYHEGPIILSFDVFFVLSLLEINVMYTVAVILPDGIEACYLSIAQQGPSQWEELHLQSFLSSVETLLSHRLKMGQGFAGCQCTLARCRLSNDISQSNYNYKAPFPA